MHVKKVASEQVTDRDGVVTAYDDCSGFMSWVLIKVAPQQYDEVLKASRRTSHPLAANYATFFDGLPVGTPSGGWLRIGTWRELRRGDIIAWEKGRKNLDHAGHGNSGHVMMVVDTPSATSTAVVNGRQVRFVPVFVLDSSSVRHFAPEKLPPLAGQTQRNGLGEGCVRLVVDAHDQLIGYWEGNYWGEGHRPIGAPSYSPMIRFARLAE